MADSTVYENCNKSAKDQSAFTLQITQYVANEQNLCPFIQIIYNDDKKFRTTICFISFYANISKLVSFCKWTRGSQEPVTFTWYGNRSKHATSNLKTIFACSWRNEESLQRRQV